MEKENDFNYGKKFHIHQNNSVKKKNKWKTSGSILLRQWNCTLSKLIKNYYRNNLQQKANIKLNVNFGETGNNYKNVSPTVIVYCKLNRLQLAICQKAYSVSVRGPVWSWPWWFTINFSVTSPVFNRTLLWIKLVIGKAADTPDSK